MGDHHYVSKAHSSNRPKVSREARKRVGIACQRCKSRRIKCSGDIRCKSCLRADAECVYPPEEKRVYISANYIRELEQRNAALEAELLRLKEETKGRLQQASTRVDLVTDLPHFDSFVLDHNFDAYAEQIAKLLVDPSGHARYIGDSAGAAYIDRIRAFVKDSLYPEADFSHYLNFYHTWDSRPIQFVPRDPYGLPARAMAASLISALFATYPPELYYLVHPTALSQHLDSCFQDPGQNHSILALINAALALGAQASAIPATSEEGIPGMDYFARVKLLLATVCEDNNIISIQILNILALFLMGANRRDAAYTYIGLALRIALAHGLHRRYATPPTSPNTSTFAIQNNIRIWWTTYVVERTLEFLMGRPSQIRDEDIDTELPSDLSGFCSSEGLFAHAELSKIMGQITSQVFRTRRRRTEDVDEALLSLRIWKDTLPPSLQLNDDEFIRSSRTVVLLHLLHNQLILVTLRTPVLEYIISQTDVLFNSEPSPPHSVCCPHLSSTIQAARQNVVLSHSLAPLSPYTFHSFHYTFSAAIAIIVQSFLANETTPSDKLLVDQAANTLTELGRTNESAESCAKMVRDLGVVVENVAMVREGLSGELAALAISPQISRGDEMMYWFL